MSRMLEGKIYRGRRTGRKQDTCDPVIVEVGTFEKEKADFDLALVRS